MSLGAVDELTLNASSKNKKDTTEQDRIILK